MPENMKEVSPSEFRKRLEELKWIEGGATTREINAAPENDFTAKVEYFIGEEKVAEAVANKDDKQRRFYVLT